ncbi:hypothetical protein HYS94_01505 [Candidatus Daviesbacteria bacterium]|nr:hypothetical protein [Candidatus Daviesbacteria bacterium]
MAIFDKYNLPTQIKTVGPDNDADFSTIGAALTAITDNTTTRRYTIKVAPGTYTEAVTIKDYVDIEGSGSTTVITQADATVLTQTNSTFLSKISNLTVRVSGAGGGTISAVAGGGGACLYENIIFENTKSAGTMWVTDTNIALSSFVDCHILHQGAGGTTNGYRAASGRSIRIVGGQAMATGGDPNIGFQADSNGGIIVVGSKLDAWTTPFNLTGAGSRNIVASGCSFSAGFSFPNDQIAVYTGRSDALYGDGSDGDVTIAAPTTLTRNMYYNTLVVNAVISTGGYRIFVRNLLSGTSSVNRNGNAASGGTEGAALANSAGGLAGGLAGGAGGISGGAGANGSNLASGLGAAGGNGGAATAGGGGGTGGTFAVAGGGRPRSSALLFGRYADQDEWRGGAGGAGGGADGNTGGGGGGGAGILFLAAREISTALTISANGGAGANGTGGNAGGGGGGGGGYVVVISQLISQSTFTVQANGGTAGSGAGTGGAGVDGSAGVAIIIKS